MNYNIQKYCAPLDCFAIWENGYTEDEVDQIRFLAELQEFSKGTVGSDPTSPAPKEQRDSDIAWITPSENSQWLYDRHAAILGHANKDHFLYDIQAFQPFQYTQYKLDQHYTWHWDVAFGWENDQRKISSILFLSDPDDYEGGEFEICVDGNLDNIQSFKPKKGDCMFFASWMPHRVKPVTSGTRCTLVSWAIGPRQS